jgi:Family of unknown function (DUF5681)
MAKSSNGTKWVKGQSGNPGGRPKLPEELKTRIQTLGERAVDALEKALDNEDPRVVVMAAKELLDRGYVKPAQVVDATLRNGDLGQAHAEALWARMNARVAVAAGAADDDTSPTH